MRTGLYVSARHDIKARYQFSSDITARIDRSAWHDRCNDPARRSIEGGSHGEQDAVRDARQASSLPKADARQRGRRRRPTRCRPSRRSRSTRRRACLNTHVLRVGRGRSSTTVLDAALIGRSSRSSSRRTALYAREQRPHEGHAGAAAGGAVDASTPGLLAEVFDRVIDDGRMLRNFVQIMRSGAVGPQVARHAAEAARAALARAARRRPDLPRVGRQRPVAGRRDPDGPPEAGDRPRARRSTAT